MLNNSDKSGHLCLVLDLRENAFSFSELRIVFDVSLSYMALCLLSGEFLSLMDVAFFSKTLCFY